MTNNSIMEKQTWVKLWASFSPVEKDAIAAALGKECNVRTATVSIWGYGIRTPKPQSQEKIVEYLRSARNYQTDCKTLFPVVLL